MQPIALPPDWRLPEGPGRGPQRRLAAPFAPWPPPSLEGGWSKALMVDLGGQLSNLLSDCSGLFEAVDGWREENQAAPAAPPGPDRRPRGAISGGSDRPGGGKVLPGSPHHGPGESWNEPEWPGVTSG